MRLHLPRAAVSLALVLSAAAQPPTAGDRPDPREIPVPPIRITLGTLPGVNELPARPELPDIFVMNDGSKVANRRQWQRRRQEMRRLLSYYSTGLMPPPPGNVRGREVKSETLPGDMRYRLIELTFGPSRKLSLHIGIFTPAGKGPFPAVILQAGTPPGAPVLPRQPQGPNQGRGENVLLVVGPGPTQPPARASAPQPTPQSMATQYKQVLDRGYSLIVFNPNDCAEDTTLRNADGSWAFRNTRFPAAYPNHDWGVLAAWAWGASRVADYLEKDPTIDKGKLIITGASRNGKSAMIAAAFDDRLMGAPVVTGGGGVGAYRFAGPRRSETLDIMQKKYPNWFSPHLHEFWGQREKLPFDQHWFLALAAPRPFLVLEGMTDAISLPEAVRQSILAAEPAYQLLGAPGRLGVNYANHGHAFTAEDWTALLDFFDQHLRGVKSTRCFDRFPSESELDAAAIRAKAWETLTANVREERYLNHSRAVEAIMREFAAPTDDLGEWGAVGLLHDIDIATTSSNLTQHGLIGARIVRDRGFGPAIVHAVESHDDRPGVARASRLDHAVYCADQVYWLIMAAGVPYPSAEFNAAQPANIYQRAAQAPNKQSILPQLTAECGNVGLTLIQAVEAAHRALRVLPPQSR